MRGQVVRHSVVLPNVLAFEHQVDHIDDHWSLCEIADDHNFIDVVDSHTSVFDCNRNRRHASSNQVFTDLLVLLSCDSDLEVLQAREMRT